MFIKKPLKNDDLESFMQNYEVLLIDQTLLMENKFHKFYTKKLLPVLKKISKQIFIPGDVLRHIQEQKDRNPLYQKIYKMYCSIQKWGMHAVREKLEDLYNSKKALLLTKNNDLAKRVARLKKSAVLIFVPEKSSFSWLRFKKEDITKVKHQVHTTKNTLSISTIPQLNDRISFEENGQSHSITLTEELSEGAEGKVYKTNTPMLAKIYQNKPGKGTSVPDYMPTKLKLLRQIKTGAQVCMPTHLLKNQQGEFVGFLMKQAQGKALQCILGGPKDIKDHIPTWKTKDLITLCLSFLKTIQSLHSKDIIVGDINPHNLFFTQNAEMFFIDCDSYQIEKYPCPVGTPEYLDPSLIGQQMAGFLRNKSHEYYAIACLLFVVLTLGRHPYDSKGSERDENMKAGRFVYPLANGDASLVPNEKAKKRWDALNPTLQEYFYHTFKKGGKYYEPKKRLAPIRWIKALQYFLRQLNP
ncbi:protein kinase domain-containing protein [Helicobacter suis]|uniref:protein kinase domain-containing protein n=2 Tax=Helicobacter suis TaxID=104628 RepID=UPI001F075399|nr:protein kinase [Helicobacter suis]